jgi:hypothetical protein
MGRLVSSFDENPTAEWRNVIQVDGLISKHRTNGLLVDANLLVLYLVGKTNGESQPSSGHNNTQLKILSCLRSLCRSSKD